MTQHVTETTKTTAPGSALVLCGISAGSSNNPDVLWLMQPLTSSQQSVAKLFSAVASYNPVADGGIQ